MEQKYYKKIGEDIKISIKSSITEDLNIIITDAVNVPPVEPPPPSNSGKIDYYIDSAGFHIRGVGIDNPVVYDNDFVHDCPSNEVLWLQHSKGKIKLVGNIMTRSMDGGPNAYKWTLDRTVGHWDQALVYAKNAGIVVPTPVRGADRMLSRPSNGSIDSTISIQSAGTDRLIALARACSASKPLVVFVGGCMTTVASAYLKDKSIADKMIILHINGYRDSATVSKSYNLADPWAAYIGIKRLKYISYAGDNNSWYGKPVVRKTNLTTAMIDSIPNTVTRSRVKDWFVNYFPVEFMADAPSILWFFNNSLWRNVYRKKENGSTVAGTDYDFLTIGANDWANYGPEMIKQLK